MANKQKKFGTDICKQLVLAEIPALRNELNSTYMRMTTNEIVCFGFVTSLIVFQWTKMPRNDVFLLVDVLFHAIVSIFGVIVPWYGCKRSKHYRQHIDEIAKYLKSAERRISPYIGWENHYATSTSGQEDRIRPGTRIILWNVLIVAAALNSLFQFVVGCYVLNREYNFLCLCTSDFWMLVNYP